MTGLKRQEVFRFTGETAAEISAGVWFSRHAVFRTWCHTDKVPRIPIAPAVGTADTEIKHHHHHHPHTLDPLRESRALRDIRFK